MVSSEDNVSSRIKTGASLLANGGTLTSVPCHKCSGVQVRLGEKITCINCGNEANTIGSSQQPKPERDKAVPARTSTVLTSVASLIEEKIALIASEIRAENDISVQSQKAELLERYLAILEKTKSLIGGAT
ncbi:MAG TPA: Sjogren's syndrome/scleroderma autoantigen 1 family protein [Nitrososphaera sp.]|nr:Sjogren's syndrome/scleroderma autoantigen 1 family protein [Nitrososphaera sp.]